MLEIMKRALSPILGMLFGFSLMASAATLETDKGRSRIQVDVKATGHNFTGELKDYTLSAAGDDATCKPTQLNLAWNFTDFKTGDEKRDKEMIKWLGGGTPKGSFSFIKCWNESPDGGTAQGTLTLNGVAKTISFPYKVKKDGEWVTLDGKVTIDHQNFNLPIIRSMALLTVEPKLVIRFHVVGKAK